jgi:hypothetical protein
METSAEICDKASTNIETLLEGQGFVYQPLDLSQQSIRLIRVLPDLSSDGTIQCEIRHATIESEYSCLSYVWGAPAERQILIHGQPHSIRDNLLSFLQVAQRKSIAKWLWIDALCIDQSNIVERTEQVRLMGLIFSHAVEVLSWLGEDDLTAEFLQRAPGGSVSKPVAIAFFGSNYWLRAWITQEIILARRGVLMADEAEVAVKELPQLVTIEASWNYMARNMRIWPDCYISTHHGAVEEDVRGRSLPWLLGRFRYKQCAVSRDRVFSFLGLCGEGSDVTVDYDVAKEEVAYDIISKCRASFCLCSIGIVCEALDISIKPGRVPDWNYIPSEAWQRIFAQITLPTVWRHEVESIVRKNCEIVTEGHKVFDPSAFEHSDAQLCDMRQCENLASAPHVHCTSPGALPDCTVSFTFDLTCICDKVRGYMTIYACDGGAWYEYRGTMHAQFQPRFEGPQYLCGHVYHSFSSDRKTCTILLTLEMLLWIHRLSNHLRSVEDVVCCQRVANVGSMEQKPFLRQALMLYEK